MADFRAAAHALDDGPPPGAISWPRLLELAVLVARLDAVPGDLLAALGEQLKSEATHVVLNTLTALHTLCLNSKQPVHDQVCGSRVMKLVERLLNKPPFPGVEMAAAQLLMDWAFLFGQGQLGPKSFAALTSSSRHRAMVQAMSASDVAVMTMEDRRLGLPQAVPAIRGLDFAAQFAVQFAAPLSGGTNGGRASSVLSQLAKAAVAASYSGSSAAAAAAAAASRNTFAAWAERVQQDPSAAAQRVLNSRQQLEADLAALQAAQASCLATAKPLARQCQQLQLQQQQDASNSRGSTAAAGSGGGGQQPDSSVLRRELDKAYLMACKAAEWREMVEVLVQQPLPDTQLSALLALSDAVNSVLDAWQQAATTELFWLLGVDTAGLTDGSPALAKAIAAATSYGGGGVTSAPGDSSSSSGNNNKNNASAAAGTPAAAGAAAAAGASSVRAPPKRNGSLTRDNSSYLDLLTGDVLPALSSCNPFLNSAPALQPARAAPAAPAAAGAGAGASTAPTPQLQSYMQQLGVVATPAAAATAGTTAAAAAGSTPRLQPPSLQQPSLLQLSSSTRTSSGSAPGTQPQQRQLTGGDRLPRRPQSHSIAAPAGPAASGDTGSSADSGAAAAAPGGTGSTSASYINPFAALDTSAILRGMHAQPSAGGANSSSDGGGSTLQQRQSVGSVSSDGGPPPQQQQQQQWGVATPVEQQLQAQVHALLAAAPACANADAASRAQLQAGILRLLAAQAQAHQQEVAELKAVAVQRFKELMAQQQQPQQQ